MIMFLHISRLFLKPLLTLHTFTDVYSSTVKYSVKNCERISVKTVNWYVNSNHWFTAGSQQVHTIVHSVLGAC